MLDYDRFAERYDDMVKQGGPRKAYAFIIEQLCKETDMSGRTVCDLGCGQGELAHRLSKLGAIVTGVDRSGKMLGYARALTVQVRWVQDDAMTLESLQDESFDIVVSCLMLMDLPDHNAVFRQSCRILKPGGRMLWLIMHPCFQSPFSHPLEDGSRKVFQYAPQFWKSNGTNTLRSMLGAYHRPLSDYLNDFMKAGFRLEKIIEPGADTAFESVPHHVGAIGYKLPA